MFLCWSLSSASSLAGPEPRSMPADYRDPVSQAAILDLPASTNQILTNRQPNKMQANIFMSIAIP